MGTYLKLKKTYFTIFNIVTKMPKMVLHSTKSIRLWKSFFNIFDEFSCMWKKQLSNLSSIILQSDNWKSVFHFANASTINDREINCCKNSSDKSVNLTTPFVSWIFYFTTTSSDQSRQENAFKIAHLIIVCV